MSLVYTSQTIHIDNCVIQSGVLILHVEYLKCNKGNTVLGKARCSKGRRYNYSKESSRVNFGPHHEFFPYFYRIQIRCFKTQYTDPHLTQWWLVVEVRVVYKALRVRL